MHKPSFLAGILAGAAASVLVVAAVPGIVPTAGRTEPRAPSPAVIVRDEPPPPPARAPDAPPMEDAAAPGAGEEETTLAGNLVSARLHSNRTAAIATLRNILSAQSQFQTTARADENQNGVGEYGAFAELAGAIGVRDGHVLNPPCLSTVFKTVVHGYVERSGYRFRIYLPGANGVPVSERSRGGFGAGELDPNLAETCWCVYAWPASDADEPTFFTNQAGDILSTKGYAGDREPRAFAAFLDASGLAAATVIDLPEDRRIGADRQEWRPCG